MFRLYTEVTPLAVGEKAALEVAQSMGADLLPEYLLDPKLTMEHSDLHQLIEFLAVKKLLSRENKEQLYIEVVAQFGQLHNYAGLAYFLPLFLKKVSLTVEERLRFIGR